MKMVEPTTDILLAGELAELMDTWEGNPPGTRLRYVLDALSSVDNHVFYKPGTFMLYLVMDNNRYDMHVYNTGPAGKDLKDWCYKTGEWMFNHTDAKVLLNFVKKDRMDLRFFMRHIGSKKACKIGDEILYTFEKQNYNME